MKCLSRISIQSSPTCICRLWRNLESTLNVSLSRLQRMESGIVEEPRQEQDGAETLQNIPLTQPPDYEKFIDQGMDSLLMSEESTHTMNKSLIEPSIDDKEESYKAEQRPVSIDESTRFPDILEVTIPTVPIRDYPSWVKAIWSQSYPNEISFYQPPPNDSNPVFIQPLYAPFGARLIASAVHLMDMISINHVEIILQREAILQSMKASTADSGFSLNSHLLLYKSSIWNEIQGTCLDLCFHCMHDPFLPLSYRGRSYDSTDEMDENITLEEYKIKGSRNRHTAKKQPVASSSLNDNDNPSSDNRCTIDPHTIICPYELMGTCADNSCPYQHFSNVRSSSILSSSMENTLAKLDLDFPVVNINRCKRIIDRLLVRKRNVGAAKSEENHGNSENGIAPADPSKITESKPDPIWKGRVHERNHRSEEDINLRIESSAILDIESDFIPFDNTVKVSSKPPTKFSVSDGVNLTNIGKGTIDPSGSDEQLFLEMFTVPWYVNPNTVDKRVKRNSCWSVSNVLGFIGFDVSSPESRYNKRGKVITVKTLRLQLKRSLGDKIPPANADSILRYNFDHINHGFLFSLLSSRTSLPFSNMHELQRALKTLEFLVAFTDAIRISIHSGRFDMVLSLVDLKNLLLSEIMGTTSKKIRPYVDDTSKDFTFKMSSELKGSEQNDPVSVSHINLMYLLSEFIEATAKGAYCGYRATTLYGGFHAQFVLMITATFLHEYFLLILQFNKKAQLVMKRDRRKGINRLVASMTSQFVASLDNLTAKFEECIEGMLATTVMTSTLLNSNSRKRMRASDSRSTSHNDRYDCMSASVIPRRDKRSSVVALNFSIPDLQKKQNCNQQWYTSTTRRINKLLECHKSGRQLAQHIANYLEHAVNQSADIYNHAEHVILSLMDAVDSLANHINGQRLPRKIHGLLKTLFYVVFSPAIFTCVSFVVTFLERERFEENNQSHKNDVNKSVDIWSIFHRYSTRSNGTLTFILKSFASITTKLESALALEVNLCEDYSAFLKTHFRALSVCILINLGLITEAQSSLANALIDQQDMDSSYAIHSYRHSELLWSQFVQMKMCYPQNLMKTKPTLTIQNFMKLSKSVQHKDGVFQCILHVLADLEVDLYNMRLHGDSKLAPKIPYSLNVMNATQFRTSPISSHDQSKQNVYFQTLDMIQNTIKSSTVEIDLPVEPFKVFPRSLLLIQNQMKNLNLSGNCIKNLPFSLGYNMRDLKVSFEFYRSI